MIRRCTPSHGIFVDAGVDEQGTEEHNRRRYSQSFLLPPHPLPVVADLLVWAELVRVKVSQRLLKHLWICLITGARAVRDPTLSGPVRAIRVDVIVIFLLVVTDETDEPETRSLSAEPPSKPTK
jgi:hypothetical protein